MSLLAEWEAEANNENSGMLRKLFMSCRYLRDPARWSQSFLMEHLCKLTPRTDFIFATQERFFLIFLTACLRRSDAATPPNEIHRRRKKAFWYAVGTNGEVAPTIRETLSDKRVPIALIETQKDDK